MAEYLTRLGIIVDIDIDESIDAARKKIAEAFSGSEVTGGFSRSLDEIEKKVGRIADAMERLGKKNPFATFTESVERAAQAIEKINKVDLRAFSEKSTKAVSKSAKTYAELAEKAGLSEASVRRLVPAIERMVQRFQAGATSIEGTKLTLGEIAKQFGITASQAKLLAAGLNAEEKALERQAVASRRAAGPVRELKKAEEDLLRIIRESEGATRGRAKQLLGQVQRGTISPEKLREAMASFTKEADSASAAVVSTAKGVQRVADKTKKATEEAKNLEEAFTRVQAVVSKLEATLRTIDLAKKVKGVGLARVKEEAQAVRSAIDATIRELSRFTALGQDNFKQIIVPFRELQSAADGVMGRIVAIKKKIAESGDDKSAIRALNQELRAEEGELKRVVAQLTSLRKQMDETFRVRRVAALRGEISKLNLSLGEAKNISSASVAEKKIQSIEKLIRLQRELFEQGGVSAQELDKRIGILTGKLLEFQRVSSSLGKFGELQASLSGLVGSQNSFENLSRIASVTGLSIERIASIPIGNLKAILNTTTDLGMAVRALWTQTGRNPFLSIENSIDSKKLLGISSAVNKINRETSELLKNAESLSGVLSDPFRSARPTVDALQHSFEGLVARFKELDAISITKSKGALGIAFKGQIQESIAALDVLVKKIGLFRQTLTPKASALAKEMEAITQEATRATQAVARLREEYAKNPGDTNLKKSLVDAEAEFDRILFKAGQLRERFQQTVDSVFINDIKREFVQLGSALESLHGKGTYVELTKRSEILSRSIEILVKNYEHLGMTAEEADVRIKALRKDLQETSENIRSVGSIQERLPRTDRFFVSLTESFKKLFVHQLRFYGGMTLIFGTVREIVDAFKDFIAFEDAFRRIGIIASFDATNMKEFGKAVGEVKEQLRELARTSPVENASTVAEQFLEIVKAGTIKTQEDPFGFQSAMKTLSGAIKLSTVAGGNLEEAINAIITIQKAWGISSDDLSRKIEVLNVALNESRLDTKDLAVTFNFLASTASVLGISFKDAALAMSVLRNAGVRASQTGTGLSNMFVRLRVGSTKLRKALKSINLELKDITPGKGRPLIESFRKIAQAARDSEVGMKGAKDVFAALFEGLAIRGGRAAVAFTNQMMRSVDSVEDLNAELEKADNGTLEFSKTLEGQYQKAIGSASKQVYILGNNFRDLFRSMADSDGTIAILIHSLNIILDALRKIGDAASFINKSSGGFFGGAISALAIRGLYRSLRRILGINKKISDSGKAVKGIYSSIFSLIGKVFTKIIGGSARAARAMEILKVAIYSIRAGILQLIEYLAAAFGISTGGAGALFFIGVTTLIGIILKLTGHLKDVTGWIGKLLSPTKSAADEFDTMAQQINKTADALERLGSTNPSAVKKAADTTSALLSRGDYLKSTDIIGLNRLRDNIKDVLKIEKSHPGPGKRSFFDWLTFNKREYPEGTTILSLQKKRYSELEKIHNPNLSSDLQFLTEDERKFVQANRHLVAFLRILNSSDSDSLQKKYAESVMSGASGQKYIGIHNLQEKRRLEDRYLKTSIDNNEKLKELLVRIENEKKSRLESQGKDVESQVASSLVDPIVTLVNKAGVKISDSLLGEMNAQIKSGSLGDVLGAFANINSLSISIGKKLSKGLSGEELDRAISTEINARFASVFTSNFVEQEKKKLASAVDAGRLVEAANIRQKISQAEAVIQLADQTRQNIEARAAGRATGLEMNTAKLEYERKIQDAEIRHRQDLAEISITDLKNEQEIKSAEVASLRSQLDAAQKQRIAEGKGLPPEGTKKIVDSIFKAIDERTAAEQAVIRKEGAKQHLPSAVIESRVSAAQRKADQEKLDAYKKAYPELYRAQEKYNRLLVQAREASETLKRAEEDRLLDGTALVNLQVDAAKKRLAADEAQLEVLYKSNDATTESIRKAQELVAADRKLLAIQQARKRLEKASGRAAGAQAALDEGRRLGTLTIEAQAKLEEEILRNRKAALIARREIDQKSGASHDVLDREAQDIAKITDELEGAGKEVRDFKVKFIGSMTTIGDVARQTALSARDSWREGFFDVMTGKFKDLGDVIKSFASSTLRRLSDLAADAAFKTLFTGGEGGFGKSFVGQLFSFLGPALGGGRPTVGIPGTPGFQTGGTRYDAAHMGGASSPFSGFSFSAWNAAQFNESAAKFGKELASRFVSPEVSTSIGKGFGKAFAPATVGAALAGNLIGHAALRRVPSGTASNVGGVLGSAVGGFFGGPAGAFVGGIGGQAVGGTFSKLASGNFKGQDYAALGIGAGIGGFGALAAGVGAFGSAGVAAAAPIAAALGPVGLIAAGALIVGALAVSIFGSKGKTAELKVAAKAMVENINGTLVLGVDAAIKDRRQFDDKLVDRVRQSFKTVFEKLLNPIIDFANSIPEQFRQPITEAVSGLQFNIGGSGSKGDVGRAVKRATANTIEQITDFYTGSGLKAINQTIDDFVSKEGRRVFGIDRMVNDFVSSITALSTGIDSDHAEEALNSINEAIASFFSGLTNTFNQIQQKTDELIGQIKQFGRTGTDLISGLNSEVARLLAQNPKTAGKARDLLKANVTSALDEFNASKGADIISSGDRLKGALREMFQFDINRPGITGAESQTLLDKYITDITNVTHKQVDAAEEQRDIAKDQLDELGKISKATKALAEYAIFGTIPSKADLGIEGSGGSIDLGGGSSPGIPIHTPTSNSDQNQGNTGKTTWDEIFKKNAPSGSGGSSGTEKKNLKDIYLFTDISGKRVTAKSISDAISKGAVLSNGDPITFDEFLHRASKSYGLFGFGGYQKYLDAFENLPKLFRGIQYVPRDNYPALLHRGEEVLTAAQAASLRSGGDTSVNIEIGAPSIHITGAGEAGDELLRQALRQGTEEMTHELTRTLTSLGFTRS